MSALEFDTLIDKFIAENQGPPVDEVGCWYNADADSLFVFQSHEPNERRRVDNLLTVFVGEVSGALVGLQIKSLRTILADLAKFPETGRPARLADLIFLTYEQARRGRRARFLGVALPWFTPSRSTWIERRAYLSAIEDFSDAVVPDGALDLARPSHSLPAPA